MEFEDVKKIQEVGMLCVCQSWCAIGVCSSSSFHMGLSWMLPCLPSLISLVSASALWLVTRLSIPPLIGRGTAPQVARAQLPVSARPVRPSISSELASELDIYRVPGSDIGRIYVGILRRVASPGSCGGIVKCHKIWASQRPDLTVPSSCLRHDLNWRVSTFGGCWWPVLRHEHATKLAANV